MYTSLVEWIEPHTLGTGYWRITDPQHPNFEENWNLTHAAGSFTEPPRLTVTTHVPSLLSDPTLSPFTAARRTDHMSSDSSTPREEDNSDESSLEQVQVDDPVLVAQLQHGLDI
jgi:hypothetical protein